jgi:DNA-binding CsgD family transcriptional regulator
MYYPGMLATVGRLEEARDRAERLYALAEEQGEPARYLPLAALCNVDSQEGAWRTAHRRAEEGIERAEESGRDALVPAFLLAKARAAMLLGDVTAAEREARNALAAHEAIGHTLRRTHCLGLLGGIELSRGDNRAAERHFGPALELAATTGIEEPNYFFWWPDALEVLVALGRLEDAEERLRPVETKARELDRVWARAAAARCRGLIMASRGDRNGSVSAFDEALRQHERLGLRFDEARTLLAYGAAERRFQQRRRARELLERALAEFEQLGAELWASRARAELDVVGGRAAMPGRLTATEQRIAELVASGRSNQQVADALFVSPKTVEWNLSKVYKKLGVSSRTELAAKLARRATRAGPQN